jgi:hypothetical protein
MADITTVRQISDNAGNEVLAARAAFNKKARTGQGIGGTTYVLTVGVGGGAISQAQLDGFVAGISHGDTSVGTTASDAFTVVGIGSFTAASSTSVIIAVQGTGTPSTTTGDYFTACTVGITATFAGLQ